METTLHLISDGLELTPLDYAQLLARLAEESKIDPDNYSLGGSVEELEAKFARLLGKERAIFMPTGTLANHLAVRALAQGRHRVLVQSESHLYVDSGDCAQVLSNLNLIPLAAGRATFTVKEAAEAFERAARGRVRTEIGVVSIETPVRRGLGETYDLNEMKKICNLARERGAGLHLDGARIFIQSAYTGVAPAQYAASFDTVYVSLYKYFNAASGAILAGPARVIDGMYHTRRMFGAGLPQSWPYAAVTLHYLDGFIDRFKRAIKISEDLIAMLSRDARLRIERIPNGTNVFKLSLKSGDANLYRVRLAKSGLMVREPDSSGSISLFVNESLNQVTAAELTARFLQALN